MKYIIAFSCTFLLTVLYSNALELGRVASLAEKSNQETVIIVDYSKNIFAKRFFVYNKKEKKIIFSTRVSHARKSGLIIASKFSNVFESKRSSLGLYVTGEKYIGKFGPSRRVTGLSSTNSNARPRAIVIHKANRVRAGLWWSLGCFTFLEKDMKKVLEFTKPGRHMIVVSD